MSRERKSSRLPLLLGMFLLAALLLPLVTSCTEEEKASTEVPTSAAPTATGPDLLIDPVKLDAGYVSGTVVGDPGKEVKVYRGIPYAAPPVGNLRWKPPQPVTAWTGIREATVFGNMCPQGQASWVSGNMGEDCLTLNVFTPAKATDEKLPVMVWFHGGGFAVGSANSLPYTWPSLPQHGVVMVGVNHRLGPIGLLALPELSAESPDGVSGNYLFLDLIASLEWIQTNIAAFGGDPNNVTIFGESGGGGKTDALVTSPLATGLFQHAILESGANSEGVGIRTVLSLEQGEALGEKLVDKLGVARDENMLTALRAVPYEKIVEATAEMSTEITEAMPEAEGVGVLDNLLVDGWLMTDTPTNIYKAGKQNDVSLLTCTNIGELIAPNTVIHLPYLIDAYTTRLEAVGKAGNGAYAALFTQVPSEWKKEGVLAFHGLELPYVFGMLAVVPNQIFFDAFAQPSGAQSVDAGLTEDDEQVSEAMMSMWAQFARTGDPNVQGLVTWPAWDPAGDQYLDISWPLEVKTGYSKLVPGE
jgi:para-nitrobenzyl esterase